MALMILISALSALKKLDALLDALSLRSLLLSILKAKCIKCINLPVNTPIPFCHIYIDIDGMVMGWFDALDALFGICISKLMHCLMHFDALFWPLLIDNDALILIEGRRAH
jgi:hypothetical protein